jgi:hypothetical protein
MLRRVALLAASLAVCAAPARSQDLRDQVRQLFTFGSCGKLICLDTTVLFGHGSHFIPASDTITSTIISFLSNSIVLSVSNTPVSSASSGTTFQLQGGVPVRTSTSAGPVFAERAQTLGRGRWFLGFGFTAMDFTRLRGVPLHHLTLTLPHQDTQPPGTPKDTLGIPAFENDIIDVNVAMDVSLMVASFSATYGVVDGVDLGVTLPLVRTSVSGNSTAQILLVGGDTLHRFGGTGANPVLTSSSSVNGSATGLGDIEGRLKINIAQTERIGIALVGTARFPTGDDKNLLGSGRFSGRALGVASARFGVFNPHLNVGYTVRDAFGQNNSVEANAGFDQLVAPWATMAFDLLSSWEVGTPEVEVPLPVQYQAPVVRSLAVTDIPRGRDNALNMAIGFKFSTRKGIQIVTDALFPLRNAGLQPALMWTVGMEYTF